MKNVNTLGSHFATKSSYLQSWFIHKLTKKIYYFSFHWFAI